MEFCKICEIFSGVTPLSSVADYTMPQFFLLREYANEQKIYQPNLKNIDEYMYGERKQSSNTQYGINPIKESRIENKATMTKCKTDFNQKCNTISALAMAKESLIKKTGRKSFDLSEISKEISILNQENKDSELKYKVN